MQNRCQAVARSVVPEPPASGVRAIAGPDVDGTGDDFDVDRFVEEGDEDYRFDGDEGPVFGEGDHEACNRVWRMFAQSSLRRGHGADFLSRDGKGAVLISSRQRRRDRTIAARKAGS